MIGWQSELLEALGGSAALSPQQMSLVEDAVRTRALRDHYDAILMAQRSLRKTRLRALVNDRLRVAEHHNRVLDRLGIKGKERGPKTIGEAIAAAPELGQ